nr:Coatomer beta subunit [Ipomoea batatas]
MALTLPTHLKFRPPNHPKRTILATHVAVFTVRTRKLTPRTLSSFKRACSDGESDVSAITQEPASPDVDTIGDSMSTIGDGYVALFVRMLGLDNDPLDRREAIEALWKYSLGGKKCVDTIMQFPGSVNLTVNLLKSESDSAREAAAGLLRVVSSVNVYRDSVAESGAIEEITGLLRRSSLSSNVKEQSLCTLWNLSVDEKHRIKMANFDLLHVLMKLLEDDEVRVVEAAGGILANLTLSKSNHKIMIEVCVIPKLARLLKTGMEGSTVIRKEAKNALLELSKDEYNKILVMEEGLVLVPLVERRSKVPSPFNAEEAKANAMDGQARQQFLDRKGAIEIEDNKLNNELLSSRFTLLPWTDGVARLVLILGLEDELAVARAAEAIADASFSEHMRVSFMEAGAVNQLTELINHPNDKIRCAVVRALERLSVSNAVCRRLEEENVLRSLINLLNHVEISSNITRTILDILTRILDPSKEMKSKFFEGPAKFSEKGWEETRNMGPGGKENEKAVSTTSLKTTNAVDALDSAVLTRLVDILKTSSPDVQRKVASILEFVSVVEPCTEKIISIDIESGLDAVFKQECLKAEADFDGQKPELHALEIEEAGYAISAASRLLTKLLDFEHFRRKINAYHFTKLLRGVLKSDIPLYHKDWVAACLVKLSSLSGPYSGFENPINMEVTLYETIPRLVEQMKTSFSPEVQEAAVVELNRIISEGVVDSTRAVSAEGGIFPLVKLIENGTERAVDAGLAILYNLSMDSENHAAIIAAGAVPVLRRIVLSQRSHWTRALRLLRNLPT